jgi:hypothetical protein
MVRFIVSADTFVTSEHGPWYKVWESPDYAIIGDMLSVAGDFVEVRARYHDSVVGKKIIHVSVNISDLALGIIEGNSDWKNIFEEAVAAL